MKQINELFHEEDIIKDFGFTFVKSYEHDGFNTNRYKKGVLEVDFTYENDILLTFDVTIDEVNSKTVSSYQILILDAILN